MNSNCQIHIRSIFLQGLLLCKNSCLPKFLSKEFLVHHSKILCRIKKTSIIAITIYSKFCEKFEKC